MAQDLQLSTRLGLHLTQQQLRFVELLEMNAPELDEAVERELEANPALEVRDAATEPERRPADETPYYLRHLPRQQGGGELPDFTPPDNSESLYDVLLTQIAQRELPADVAAFAEYIVGNLDSNGYLRRPLRAMVEDLAYSRGLEIPADVAQRGYEVVRELDPAGVGAENLRDCLLLQLRRLPQSTVRDNAIRILDEQFEAFSMRHSHRIISALHLTREEIEEANSLILTLNPKPGAPYGGAEETAAGVIVPDYNVSRDDGELFISLNNRIPELAIEESFSEAVRGMELRRGRPRKGTEFVRDRYKSAVDFINVLRQRQQTMLAIMTAIVAHQREYFETGDVYTLRPMMLKDIESATGYDKSVISRATNNKYVSMPWGVVLPMRSFFSDSVNSAPADDEDTDILTNRQIEAAIQELVDAEDKKHPLSDEKLRGELLKRGYDVSRRTVAKYRDRKGILVARLRKQL
ncbi:MAG: RNA polymerase factor sigma-54 [Muribaculaceae bacterium]|nr:RNA polymerase factor sigma-54 [Muribaculaceae bacterium]